jgi:integrase
VRAVKRKLKNGESRWTVRVTIAGKKHAVTGTTKREVEEKAHALKEAQRRRQLNLPSREVAAPDITYGELVDRVLDQYPNRPQSKRAHEENLARSRREFGDVLIREMLPETIGAWLARLPLKPTTKRNTLKSMRYAFGRAVKWRYLHENPAKLVEMPPEPGYDACPFESWEEVRNVAQQFANSRDKALVLFACATGLRPQEWLVLQWRDVDLTRRALRVNRTLQDGAPIEHEGKTRGALRTVLLSDIALEALQAVLPPLQGADTQEPSRSAFVFPGDRKGWIDVRAWSRHRWKKALAAAGVDYREPYGMRDTFATLSLNDGAPLEWISEQMGHTDIDTTRKHYARWRPSTDYRIVDELNRRRAEARGLKEDSQVAGQ